MLDEKGIFDDLNQSPEHRAQVKIALKKLGESAVGMSNITQDATDSIAKTIALTQTNIAYDALRESFHVLFEAVNTEKIISLAMNNLVETFSDSDYSKQLHNILTQTFALQEHLNTFEHVDSKHYLEEDYIEINQSLLSDYESSNKLEIPKDAYAEIPGNRLKIKTPSFLDIVNTLLAFISLIVAVLSLTSDSNKEIIELLKKQNDILYQALEQSDYSNSSEATLLENMKEALRQDGSIPESHPDIGNSFSEPPHNSLD